jgi:predicted DNA-binding antitoxin AbrB/MazE fold protein
MSIMSEPIDAIFENGMFRPLIPISLPEQQRVSLVVQPSQDDELLDEDAMELAAKEGDSTVPLIDLRNRLSKIVGSFSDSVIAERGEY